MQLAFLIQAEDHRGAVQELLDGAPRLPLSLAGAGVVTSLVRILTEISPRVDRRLLAAFERLAPPNQIRYEPYGPSTGTLSAESARRVGRPRQAELVGSLAIAASGLSTRQREVAELVAKGHSNKEVGDLLGLSSRTVEVHLTRIFREFEVRTRSELLARINPHKGADETFI